MKLVEEQIHVGNAPADGNGTALARPEPPPTKATPPAPAKVAAPRLVSLDAYRGFIMLAMASGGFGFAQIARRLPNSDFWHFLGFHFDHVVWEGGGFWDMI